MSAHIETFTGAALPALAAWWNEAFAGFRNFWPVTPEVLRVRLMDRCTAVERFDPSGLFLAREGERVVGAAHAGEMPEPVCRVLDPAWPGGTRGWIGLLCVLREHRRRGVGAALWSAVEARLAGCRERFVDGRGWNPFYGNADGPATPFFGTAEGISLPVAEADTLGFLERRGHRPSARGVTMERDLPDVAPGAAPPGVDLAVVEEGLPGLGLSLEEADPFLPVGPYFAVVALEGRRVAGALCAYELAELGRAHWGIWSLAVDAARRGRGVGGAMLARALAEMALRGGRTCEALTIPSESPAAPALYERAGFRPVAEWWIY